MVEHSLFAFAAILAPIIAAFIAHLIARIPRIGNSLAKGLCVTTSFATLIMVLTLTFMVVENGPIVNSFSIAPLPIGELALSLYVDELALIPTVFFAFFASLATTYSVKYLSPENRYRPVPKNFNKGFSFMLLFLGSLIGCCFSSNMIAFLIFWEMTSICSFFLVGFWYEDSKCRAAAFKTFILLHVGTFGLLIGAISIYPIVGTWEIHSWSQSLLEHPVLPIVVLMFFIGILPKAVQFPFHTWLPDATVTATPITVYVHAGFLLGLYALPRFFGQILAPYINTFQVLPSPLSSLFGNINIWTFIISFTGAFTSIIAPFFGLLEKESKRVVAYCHVSALGSTVMTLGFATPLGIAAGLLGMVYHVLFIALIFLALGGVIFQVGKTSMDSMCGLSSYMPITAANGILGALSMAGFPFLGYFAAMWLGIHAALELNAPIFVILLLFSSVLKTAAILRMTNAVFFGKAVESKRKIVESHTLMLLPMLLLSTCLLVFGAFPQLLLNYLVIPAINRLQPGPSSGLASNPSNIITESGFWNPIGATITFFLYLSLIVVGIYLTSKRSVARIERVYIKEDEAFKPFLCGEDMHLLDGARSSHFYHTLTDVLKIDAICRALDIDRLYNASSEVFFAFCRKLLRFDIQQKYFQAVLSFIVGAVIVVLIAIFGG